MPIQVVPCSSKGTQVDIDKYRLVVGEVQVEIYRTYGSCIRGKIDQLHFLI